MGGASLCTAGLRHECGLIQCDGGRGRGSGEGVMLGVGGGEEMMGGYVGWGVVGKEVMPGVRVGAPGMWSL